MGRKKKERLTVRKDGRYKCKYHGLQFYGKSPEEALAARDDYIANQNRGFQRQTVSGYAVPWLKRTFPEVADSTYAGLAIHLQHLVDEIGEKRIADVVPSDIKGVYSNQYKGRSNSYIKSARQLYCLLFDSAVADGACRSNPARDRTAKPHKGTPPKTRPITEQEREWIETLCTDHRAHPIIMTMLYAGLRPQEAKAIVIERDIDFEAKTITLHEFAHYTENGQKYALSDVGKTDKANRQIPLFPPLEQALKGRKGRLITSAHGEDINHTTWNVVWRSYKTKMESAINGIDRRWYGKTKEHKKLLAEGKALPPWKSFDIVPYDLRHSFCTMCRDAGVEINTCIKWMGHADSKMILAVYDAVSEDRSEAERKKVEKRLIGVQNGVQTKKETPETVEK